MEDKWDSNNTGLPILKVVPTNTYQCGWLHVLQSDIHIRPIAVVPCQLNQAAYHFGACLSLVAVSEAWISMVTAFRELLSMFYSSRAYLASRICFSMSAASGACFWILFSNSAICCLKSPSSRSCFSMFPISGTCFATYPASEICFPTSPISRTHFPIYPASYALGWIRRDPPLRAYPGDSDIWGKCVVRVPSMGQNFIVINVFLHLGVYRFLCQNAPGWV